MGNVYEKKRQKYSGIEKVQILRRHLVDKTPVSDICDEYRLQPAVFYRWQKIFLRMKLQHLSDFVLYLTVSARLGGRFSSSYGFMTISCK